MPIFSGEQGVAHDTTDNWGVNKSSAMTSPSGDTPSATVGARGRSSSKRDRASAALQEAPRAASHSLHNAVVISVISLATMK